MMNVKKCHQLTKLCTPQWDQNAVFCTLPVTPLTALLSLLCGADKVCFGFVFMGLTFICLLLFLLFDLFS